MSSITYLMCNSPIFMAMEEKMKEQDRAATTAKAAGLPKPKRTGPSKSTVQQHKNHAIHYAKWCRATYGCKEYESCRCHIQEYADFLVAQGKAASTIHTYLAGVCFAYGIKMQEISKPIRYTSDNTQGRGHKKSDNRPDRQPVDRRDTVGAVLQAALERQGCAGAVSVFHLSHWRADVTVDNYILAVAKDSLLRGAER